MSLISCRKITEYRQKAEFHYINETNHLITYDDPRTKITIQPKSSVILYEELDGAKTSSPTSYHSPFVGNSNGPVYIKFNNQRCLVSTYDAVHSIIDVKNYLAERLGERSFKFTYTFTEADYNRAVTCP